MIVVFAQHVNAQNMRALNTMLNRQWQGQQMGMMMAAGRFNYNNPGNLKYNFIVTMADSSKKEVSSKIYSDTATHKTYLLFVDKSVPKSDPNRNKKIYPSQTVSIARDVAGPGPGFNRADYVAPPPRFFNGIAKDSCWMFKVISGPINAYSCLSEEGDTQIFDPSTIVGIQLNNGAIEKFNEENLKNMVGQDIDALENIQKKNYYKAIKKYNHNAAKAAKK
ncbi:hypothetical protein [Mucilaginibacter sp. OK268]|uniref:hypothetical protein n=1 Tax=Mucilaginibacter sp. OK268 TaxID=1881048 RepID=UPI0015A29C61|nr:hypothetical protein [Mucilaginibacter sp. OK268]